MLENPKAHEKPGRLPVPIRSESRNKVVGWPRLKQKAAAAVLRAAQNGQSAGAQVPQRPHGGRPERTKIQSTPLKKIGKPRVSRIIRMSTPVCGGSPQTMK